MASVNRVTLLGRLGRDPEIRQATSGASIANFPLATSYRHRDATGTIVEDTEWHDIVCFNRLADVAKEWLRKGYQCYLEGRISSKKFVGKDGVERTRYQIVCERLQLLDNKPSQNESRSESRKENKTAYQDEDEVPF